MLPNIHAEEGREAGGGARVLVRGGGDGELTRCLVVPEPSPTGTLHGDRLGRELGLECVEGAEIALDHGQQLALGRRALTRRGKVLPEDGMVDVAASVELDGALQGYHRGDVPLQLRLSVLLHRRVEVGDVRLMVLGVVQLHDLAADDGLEGAVIVRQVRQLGGDDRARGLACNRGLGDGAHEAGSGGAKHREVFENSPCASLWSPRSTWK